MSHCSEMALQSETTFLVVSASLKGECTIPGAFLYLLYQEKYLLCSSSWFLIVLF